MYSTWLSEIIFHTAHRIAQIKPTITSRNFYGFNIKLGEEFKMDLCLTEQTFTRKVTWWLDIDFVICCYYRKDHDTT